jgi:hypothetical protein
VEYHHIRRGFKPKWGITLPRHVFRLPRNMTWSAENVQYNFTLHLSAVSTCPKIPKLSIMISHLEGITNIVICEGL